MSRVSAISRLRNAHPDHRAIARGMAVGALFVFLAKLAGAAKEMAIAWRYGVSEIVDAYLFIYNLANWPVAVWFSVLVVVLVPLAAGIRERTPHELPRFRAELLGITLLLGSFLWVLDSFLLPFLVRSTISGLSGAALNYARDIAPAFSAVLFLGMPISLLSAWMQADRQHANTLLEGVPALVLLLILVFTYRGDARTLVWGTLAGLAVHLGSLAIALLKRGELEGPRFAFRSPQWKAFWQGFGIMLAGQAVMSFANIVDQLFAARVGPGGISMLNYSNRIVGLVLSLGATAIGRATLPVFSRAEARGSTHVTRMAVHWANILLLLGILATIVGWWLAPLVVAGLFERGAFTESDTRAVAEVLRYGLVQVPLFLPSLVLVSVMSSRRRYTVLFISGIVGLSAKLVGNSLLVPFMGLNGLVLANAVVYGINFGFLALVLRFSNPTPLRGEP